MAYFEALALRIDFKTQLHPECLAKIPSSSLVFIHERKLCFADELR